MMAEDGGGCGRCGSLTFNQDWLKAFGVVLCNTCRRDEQLVSKSTAKAEYLLTDSDLKKLGSITKPNPQNKEWQPMRLYMLSQVQAASYAKHGGADALQAAHHAALDSKIQARARRKQDAQAKAAAEERRLERAKRKLLEREEHARAARARLAEAVEEEVVDEEQGLVERRYEDGTVVEVETI